MTGDMPISHIGSMEKLKTYLKRNALSQAVFAERVGITQSALSRICSGENMPSLVLASKIAAMTGQAVPMDAWVQPENHHFDLGVCFPAHTINAA